ncbi:sensor domain-containing protein [Mycobacterium sp. E136]|uniref:sensor domain-containing protein n=1 Tax=Mycobacterium sp. E136 TaxID=1834125 RepID=UPI0012E8664C|nr:sensor domain-containing protein [Mycobacterium sp. E136]
MWCRASAVGGVLALVVSSLIAGCGAAAEQTTQSGADRSSTFTTSRGTAPPNEYAWLTTVLPSDQELTTAAGYQIRMGEPPSVGSRLRNTLAGSREMTERQCLGVISSFEEEVYGAAPVRAVTYATESKVTFGAAAFDSSDEARKLFDTFADEWLGCSGRTVVRDEGAYTSGYRITEVEMTADVLSSVDELTSDSPTGVRVAVQRALGVAKDCIVEATVPITEPSPNEAPVSTGSATDLVKAMLARIQAVRP